MLKRISSSTTRAVAWGVARFIFNRQRGSGTVVAPNRQTAASKFASGASATQRTPSGA